VRAPQRAVGASRRLLGAAGKKMRVRFGALLVDAVRFDEALARIEALVDAKRGGVVFTPNVDHVVVAEREPRLRAAYARCELSLADGQPLVWTSGLLGLRLPEKVSGSDVLRPVFALSARRKYRVYLLGAAPGVVEEASEKLKTDYGLEVCGLEAPRIGLAPSPEEEALVERIRAAAPDVLLVFLGAPKAEMFLDRVRDKLGPVVAVSLGASLDFYVGRVRRAPVWMQRTGLEWFYRLVQEPRRLAKRYLVDDVRFLGIFARTLRLPRAERVVP
jgi:N-acetylglucosaminyldiphosphoundecaprenol N-acetyl-beta-D-mannosaminyltransferase